MRFWDSSAIVPLLIGEPRTEAMLELLRKDAQILASFITPLEVSSAIWRRLHKSTLNVGERAYAEKMFARLSNNWSQADKLHRITEIALDLLTSGLDVAVGQRGHAAPDLPRRHIHFDAVVVQDLDNRLANARVVVIGKHIDEISNTLVAATRSLGPATFARAPQETALGEIR